MSGKSSHSADTRWMFRARDLPSSLDSLLSRSSGVLCLGLLMTSEKAQEVVRDLHISLPFWLFQFTTGGNANITKSAFGLLFPVPAELPLAALASTYYGSNLPGHTSWLDWTTPYQELATLAERLDSIGLEIDSQDYFAFAEGLLPIDFERAWEYVHANSLRVVTDFSNPRNERELKAQNTFAFMSSAKATHSALLDAWDQILEQVESPVRPQLAPRLLGFMIIANSD